MKRKLVLPGLLAAVILLALPGVSSSHHCTTSGVSPWAAYACETGGGRTYTPCFPENPSETDQCKDESTGTWYQWCFDNIGGGYKWLPQDEWWKCNTTN